MVTVGDIVGMLDHKVYKVLFAHKVAPAEDVSGESSVLQHSVHGIFAVACPLCHLSWR